MWGKKKEEEEPKPEKNKVVYDVEKDKSKGLFAELLSQSLKDAQKIEEDDDEELDEEYDEDEELEDEEEDEEENPFNIRKFVIGLFIFILLGSFVAYMWAANSEVFNLVKIQSMDGTKVSSGDILSLTSGEIGKNLMLVNSSRIQKDVESIPYVGNAYVRKVLPDTLDITFTERTPYAVVLSGDSYFTMDQFGYLLEENTSNELNLPVLFSLFSSDYKLGEMLRGTDMIKYKNIIYLLQVADNIEFGYNISKIGYEDSENIKFSVEDTEIEVLYGALKKEQATDKLLYLKEIIRKSNSQGLKGYLDMSADNYYEKSVLNSKI